MMPRYSKSRIKGKGNSYQMVDAPAHTELRAAINPDINPETATDTGSDAPNAIHVVGTSGDVTEKRKRLRVLIAGASGVIGFPTLQLAREAGLWVRTLSRSRWKAAKVSIYSDELWLRDATNRVAIHGICQGTDVVLSCLGASLDMRDEDKRGFSEIDFEANLNLLEDAKEAKVARFVYVSVFVAEHCENTAYVQAHRRFESALRESGLNYSIVRIAGLHSTLDSMFAMARSGGLTLIGKGSAKTNPIHPEDAAQLCMDNLFLGPELIEAGGPVVYTRREIAEMVCETLDAKPNFNSVPGLLMRLQSELTRPFNPRKANLLELLPAISKSDVVAPRYGSRTLADYLVEHTGMGMSTPNVA